MIFSNNIACVVLLHMTKCTNIAQCKYCVVVIFSNPGTNHKQLCKHHIIDSSDSQIAKGKLKR